MALSQIKVFMQIRGDSDADRTKHDAKKSLRKLSGALTLTLEDADVVVFHNGSATVLQNALGLGKAVVSPEWLGACRTAGKLVDYDAFKLVDSHTSPRMLKAVVAAATGVVTTDETPERAVAPLAAKRATVLLDDSQSQSQKPAEVTLAKSSRTVVATLEPVVCKKSPAAPMPTPAAAKLVPAAAMVTKPEKPYLESDSPLVPPAPATPSKRRVAVPAAAKGKAVVAPVVNPPPPPPAPPAPATAPTRNTTTARRLIDDDDDDDNLFVVRAAAAPSVAPPATKMAPAKKRSVDETSGAAAQQVPKPQPPPPKEPATTKAAATPPPPPPQQKRRAGKVVKRSDSYSDFVVPNATSASVIVAFSGVEDRDTLRGVVAALGGAVVDEVFGRTAKKPTHLIVEGTILSPKILFALCSGIPVLSPQWLLSSLCAGTWLSLDGTEAESFFCPLFDQQSHRQRLALIRERDRKMLEDRPMRGPQFMDGVTLYFDGKSEYPGNAVFHELVQLAGGEVVRNAEATGLSAIIDMTGGGDAAGNSPASKSGSPKKTPLITRADVPRVRLQWLIDSIVKCAVLPFEDFVLNVALAQPNHDGANGSSGGRGAAAGTSPSARQSTAVATAVLGRTPDATSNATIALALKKRSPGPSSAVKAAQNQWSTQQLRESSASDSDIDDE